MGILSGILVAGLVALACCVVSVDAAGDYSLTPKFVDLPQTTMAGVATVTSLASAPSDCPALWQKFGDSFALDASGLDTARYAYGVELYPKSFSQSHQFTYLCAYAVPAGAEPPIALVARTLPASRCAVFDVPGGVKGLGRAFEYIYSVWLPASAYQAAFPFDLERYPSGSFNADALPVEILIPIKAKQTAR